MTLMRKYICFQFASETAKVKFVGAKRHRMVRKINIAYISLLISVAKLLAKDKGDFFFLLSNMSLKNFWLITSHLSVLAYIEITQNKVRQYEHNSALNTTEFEDLLRKLKFNN